MANPTTNFGWVMPTSASLVTNLPANLDTALQGTDTSLLTYSRIATVTATAAGTTTLTVSSQRGQTFTGTTTQTVVLPVTSTLKSGDSFEIMNASTGVVTVQSSGANTVLAMATMTRAVFTVVLTSGTTAASWTVATAVVAGGMTLLSTTSLSGATTTVSSIDQTYTRLHVIIRGMTNATADGIFRIAPNGATNLTTQNGIYSVLAVGTVIASADDYANNGRAISRTSAVNDFTFIIDNYTDTANPKAFQLFGGYLDTGGNPGSASASGYYKSTSAVTSLVFSNSGGNMSTGSVLVYGVK